MRKSLAIFRCQQRQRPATARYCLTEIIEEARNVSIADVHLIPQIGETPCSEVIRDQTRFTCSRWRPHPCDRPFSAAIEKTKETRPCDRVC